MRATSHGACAEVGAALAAQPWLDRVPVTLVATPTFDARALAADRRRRLDRRSAPDAPGLATCSRRRRATRSRSTVEWTLDGAVPLTVHLPDRALDVGPRADLSFVSAA